MYQPSAALGTECRGADSEFVTSAPLTLRVTPANSSTTKSRPQNILNKKNKKTPFSTFLNEFKCVEHHYDFSFYYGHIFLQLSDNNNVMLYMQNECM